MTSEQPTEFLVEAAEAGRRLDVFLAGRCPAHSRVQLRRAITDGAVLVDGQRAKPAYRLNAGQRVTLVVPALPAEAHDARVTHLVTEHGVRAVADGP